MIGDFKTLHSLQ